MKFIFLNFLTVCIFCICYNISKQSKQRFIQHPRINHINVGKENLPKKVPWNMAVHQFFTTHQIQYNCFGAKKNFFISVQKNRFGSITIDIQTILSNLDIK